MNHDVLFNKLDLYGIRRTTFCLFKKYLTIRHRYVEYDNENSF